MADDLDPERAATMLVQQHGDDAARYAAEWATALLEAGNRRDARRFVRIIREIRTMTRPREETRKPRRAARAPASAPRRRPT
jgi:hypothetical protein